MSITIEIADEFDRSSDHERFRQAARQVLSEAGIEGGEISIAIVDDARMHDLNRQYLQHDYATDVLSFVFEQDPERRSLDGEIIVSAEYAAREAARYGWSAEDELLLYVIHGCLHLAGLDDQSPADRSAMREAETRHLASFGLHHRYQPEDG
jgi:probable rRNA maturation factor